MEVYKILSEEKREKIALTALPGNVMAVKGRAEFEPKACCLVPSLLLQHTWNTVSAVHGGCTFVNSSSWAQRQALLGGVSITPYSFTAASAHLATLDSHSWGISGYCCSPVFHSHCLISRVMCF